MQAEDKQVRHEAILDAATRLLERSPGQIARMTDVADEAGLANGTVYLYFASKEELLLAVHERHFRDLAPGDGVALLRRTYALILGLWQLSGRPGLREHAATADGDAALPDAFVADLDRALLAPWSGTIAAGNGRRAR